MIQIRNLDKTIDNKPILKDISVDIKKGKLTSLIGPNGAGKSTLLSAISRLFSYENGSILIEDKEISEYKTDDLAKKLIQLNEIKHRNIKTLSGGQRQRAYIAMTIAQDTDYILLDEPLNNLDMKHSVQIMQTLRDLCRQLNKTIIIVLHDINFASCYSDDIIALKQGELVKADDKDNVIQSDILKSLYEMEVRIEEIRGQRICLYYDETTFDSV